jgi:tRNA G26 N,N-dimethylase Trm1
MTVERLVKRTIYIAECEKCGEKHIKSENPPREVQCTECKTWLTYKEQSWTGPDTFG